MGVLLRPCSLSETAPLGDLFPDARRGIFRPRRLSLHWNVVLVARVLRQTVGAAMSASLREQIMGRIRAEYREMPDMSLLSEQVQRLCGLEGALCKEALDALVDAKFLRVRSDGSYVRGAEDRDHATSRGAETSGGIFPGRPQSV
jgi:hypothetical protein